MWNFVEILCLQSAMCEFYEIFQNSFFAGPILAAFSTSRIYNTEPRGLKLEGDTTESLWHIFYFDISWIPYIRLMTLNCSKLGHAVTFMIYLASVVTLIFLPKTLIWNKIMFPASNSLNFAKLVENELMKRMSEKFYQYSFFYPVYGCFFKYRKSLSPKNHITLQKSSSV